MHATALIFQPDRLRRRGSARHAHARSGGTQRVAAGRQPAAECARGGPGPAVIRSDDEALSLTKSGSELFDVLRSGLSRLESVIGRLRGSQESDVVTDQCRLGLSHILVDSPASEDAGGVSAPTTEDRQSIARQRRRRLGGSANSIRPRRLGRELGHKDVRRKTSFRCAVRCIWGAASRPCRSSN